MKTKLQTITPKRTALALLVVSVSCAGANIGNGRAAVSVADVAKASLAAPTLVPYTTANLFVKAKPQVRRPAAIASCSEWTFLQSKCQLPQVHRAKSHSRTTRFCYAPYLHFPTPCPRSNGRA
jgi:hypothetical protein